MFNISNTDFRTPLGKILRFPLKLIPDKTVLPILQGPIKGKRWIKGSATNGCWLGTYEMEKQILFGDYINPGMVIYDIGANAGYYSLLASILTGSGGKVYSFEPLPENIYYLKKHIELNNLKNVKVIEKAVCDKVSTTRFSIGDNRLVGYISDQGKIEVETITIDEFIKEGNPVPDLIKMDIEGAEYDALTGAKELLKNRKPVIFLATHSSELRANCLKLMAELGYTLRTIDKKPVDEADEFVFK